MNNSSTFNKAPIMSIKNIFSQKVSPASFGVMHAKTPTAQKVVTLPEKPVQTPVYSSMKNPAAAPARPQKPVHRHSGSIGTSCHPTSAGTADRRALLQKNEDKRMSARNLRKIKRRLFLEAVNSDQPSRIKSPRNSILQDAAGKKKRTGRE